MLVDLLIVDAYLAIAISLLAAAISLENHRGNIADLARISIEDITKGEVAVARSLLGAATRSDDVPRPSSSEESELRDAYFRILWAIARVGQTVDRLKRGWVLYARLRPRYIKAVKLHVAIMSEEVLRTRCQLNRVPGSRLDDTEMIATMNTVLRKLAIEASGPGCKGCCHLVVGGQLSSRWRRVLGALASN